MLQRCFAVTKGHLSKYRLLANELTPAASLEANEIILNIDRFAFTANNMTYAHAGGPPLNYWHFYDKLANDKTLGIIPVWGFATVALSRNSNIAEGSRHYGFYPMASSVKFNPSKADVPSFTVTRDDPELAAMYNTYLNTASDPFYTTSSCENNMMIFRPLFLTSFFLNDYCWNQFRSSVDQIILTSASSKTAFALAFQLKQRGVKVIGLTSQRNVAFCETLSLYDSLYSYDQISEIPSNTTKTVVVDMARSHDVNLAIDKHFAKHIVQNVGVGMTHNTVLSGDKTALSEHAQITRTFFFAPAWIKRRIAEDASIMETAAASYVKFTATSDENQWLDFNTDMTVEEVYAASESNSVNPNTGLITKVEP
ncbi:hypothetical protein TrST_g1243 [Triparma strigata]|uniref:DUF2855 family protein n=1 Tax=Triparma strigata TaxID=1606541 RepID=A0A9W7E1S1_9STRA|nr:hypothetical protein TrST_g1243 [Triparma strigata]